MILALGIDSVDIDRFKNWQNYSKKQLGRFFSQTEIDYCISGPKKSAERFAVRFAAKEALFKSISQFYPEKGFRLLFVAKNCEVIKTLAAPELSVDWNALNLPKLKVLISLTHTRQTASAVVILQE